MTDLTELEMACADPKDIEEYENLTRQIETVKAKEELMPLLKRRVVARSHILGAPLNLIKKSLCTSNNSN